MFGDENSTIIVLRPLDGSAGSRSPRLGLYPYEFSFRKIDESTILLRGCGLKKNCRNMPSILGFSTSGESGNCSHASVVSQRDVLGA